MSKPRDTYKYYFKVGNKIIHRGITKDLQQQEEDYQQEHLTGHIMKVGRRTTATAARRWQREQGH